MPDPRFEKLSPRHHHFVQVQDPWHIAVLARMPAFDVAFMQGRVSNGPGEAGLHAGPIETVWYSADPEGVLLGEWGFDQPQVNH